MFKIPSVLATIDARKLQELIQGNMPPVIQKSDRGSSNAKGRWITHNDHRIFIPHMSSAASARHAATRRAVDRATARLPRWMKAATGNYVQIYNMRLLDKIKVKGTGINGLIVAHFDGERTILRNGWLRERLGSKYNVNDFVLHEASHAVTAHGHNFDPMSPTRPERERTYIKAFMTAGTAEHASPHKYASKYHPGSAVGFHEHFAEWNSLYHRNRTAYTRIAKRHPRTADAYRRLSQYYATAQTSNTTAKAESAVEDTVVFYDSNLTPLPSEHGATFAHVYQDGRVSLVWLPPQSQLDDFDRTFGGKD